MSKRKFIILIIILVAIVAGGFWYFSSQSKETGQSIGSTISNFWGDFNPFAKLLNKEEAGEEVVNVGEEDPSTLSEEQKRERFTKVSVNPVSGYTVFQKERYLDLAKEFTPETLEEEIEGLDTLDATINSDSDLSAPSAEYATAVRYAEKSTGNIFQTFADEISERKYSSTVVKGVHETVFGDSGNSLIMRYLKSDGKTIASYVGTLPKEVLGQDSVTANDLSGTFLPENVLEVAYSADGSKMFYIIPYKDGVLGISAFADSSRKNQIFESAFSEWLIAWPNKDIITLTTKPSYSVDGYMYKLNPNTKSFDKVLSGIKGLTTNMSPDGKYVLYADQNNSLNVYDTTTKKKFQLSIKTLPEKCVWGSDNETIFCGVPKYIEQNEYPDVWYQGVVSFNDDIWRVDVISTNAQLILDPNLYNDGASVDVINPKVDSAMKYFFFIDKKEGHLYRYKMF